MARLRQRGAEGGADLARPEHSDGKASWAITSMHDVPSLLTRWTCRTGYPAAGLSHVTGLLPRVEVPTNPTRAHKLCTPVGMNKGEGIFIAWPRAPGPGCGPDARSDDVLPPVEVHPGRPTADWPAGKSSNRLVTPVRALLN
ncbi:hypothetical protein GCM10009560_68310 [Nonomuraea longicatena]|uniref:Uncharacterized protein n=1 Tax=Nonomuraea longicatena TaxID=83682 RepID=A0ABN1QZP1_9ACTN